ncbi:hypothetical protein [Undibacterium sp. Ji42W]|uniref:hypothetical protein n=1 Tax=Undibacterium sp. Ji42W TaxID=3413039 RepID=UPI003BF4CC91
MGLRNSCGYRKLNSYKLMLVSHRHLHLELQSIYIFLLTSSVLRARPFVFKLMNIPYKKFSVLLLSLIVTASAMAENKGNGGSAMWGRFNNGNAQQKNDAARKEEKQHERQLNKQAEKNSLLERCNDARHIGERACGSAEDNKKAGRLTPDEKRALRRQIQDVGHELYRPAR